MVRDLIHTTKDKMSCTFNRKKKSKSTAEEEGKGATLSCLFTVSPFVLHLPRNRADQRSLLRRFARLPPCIRREPGYSRRGLHLVLKKALCL